MTKEQILESMFRKLPYSYHIKNIDLSAKDEVRFTWRGTSYVADTFGSVWEVENGCLVSSDRSILMRFVLRQHAVENAEQDQPTTTS